MSKITIFNIQNFNNNKNYRHTTVQKFGVGTIFKRF